MNLATISAQLEEFLASAPCNHVQPEDAIEPDLIGLAIYDAPLLGVADAADPVFETFKDPQVLGPETLLPSDFLPGAQSVISFFLPFSAQVRESNRRDPVEPSSEWLHGRIEGQDAIIAFGNELVRILEDAGHRALFPTVDPRTVFVTPFRSSWSERHVAYACGLGTFGLSKGLITKRGIAGRFGSVVTDARIPATGREYSSPFEYCIMCGECATMCPYQAIDPTRGIVNGKDHEVCQQILTQLRVGGASQKSRYGCGKCQVNVPCECGLPY